MHEHAREGAALNLNQAIQSRLQDVILQLYHSGTQLRHVLLFHECTLSPACVDLTIGVCTSLKRHRAHIQRISKYKSFEFAQNGGSRTFTKATYFVALNATCNVNSFEVFSPSLECAETWLCSSKSLTSQIQAAITAVPGVFRFRVYTHSPDGLESVRGMCVTGRGGPERVRGDVKLIVQRRGVAEGPRP